MKRISVLISVLLIGTSTALFAQSKVDINESAILKKIEKATADTSNDKKASKASTWVTQGDALMESVTAVSNNLYEMEESLLTLMFGNKKAEPVTIGNAAFVKKSYPYFDAYLDNAGMLRGWVFTKEIYPNAVALAVEAYSKAKELDTDGKSADKIQKGLQGIYDYYYTLGTRLFAIHMYEDAGDTFAMAYDVTRTPGYTITDMSSVAGLARDAGLAYYYGRQHQKSVDFLNKAIDMGYQDDGTVYALLYGSMTQMAADKSEEERPAIYEQAKEMLESAMEMYPSNDSIIEALTDIYSRLGMNLDLIAPKIMAAIEKDQNNPALWNSLGRVYEAHKDYDNAIKAYGKVSELLPDNAQFVYAVGYIYAQKAQDTADKFYNKSYASNAERDAALSEISDLYFTALDYAERAYAMDPDNFYTVNLMKIITFHLRTTSDEMNAKFEKYNALYNSMLNN